MSTGQISLLFALWSLAALLTGVPTGALADRWSRRGCLVVAGAVKGAGFLLWLYFPSFPGFAAGFVVWGIAGSLVSGALEALVYDGLIAYGAEADYPRVLGRVNAAELVGGLLAAVAATALFPYGGFTLVVWASAGLCCWSSALATRLPEPRHTIEEPETAGVLAALRLVVRDFRLLRLVAVVALLTSIDTSEEYFPLMARSWGVPLGWIPLATAAIPVAGAVGAMVAASGGDWRLGRILGVGGGLLFIAGLLGRPAGIALVAVFYGLYRAVLVVAGARLQQAIDSSSRATVTSVVGIGEEACVYLMYAAWALGGVLLGAATVLAVALLVGRLLHR